MTSGPGYRGPGSGYTLARAGRARLLVSHADRDHAVELLKAAFAEGRLDKDEYESRMSRAFAARTYADLDALTADLPRPGPAARLRTDGMAVAALVCGIAEFFTFGLTAIPAVVLGHVARQRIRRTGREGKSVATAGLALGWIGVTIWVLVITVFVAAGVALTHGHTVKPH